MSDAPVTKLDQVQHRFLIKQTPDTELDQVNYHYLVKTGHAVQLDQVSLKALVKDNSPMPLTYELTPHQYIMNGIKNEIYLPVKEKYIYFSHPETSDQKPFNAKLRMNVMRESGFKGYVTLQYRRQPISTLLYMKDVYEDLKPNLDEITTYHELLDEFNRVFGTAVPSSEIEDGVIDYDGTVEFIATNESFFWEAGTRIDLGQFNPLGKYRDLSLSTFSMPSHVQVRLNNTNVSEVRHTQARAAEYNDRRM